MDIEYPIKNFHAHLLSHSKIKGIMKVLCCEVSVL